MSHRSLFASILVGFVLVAGIGAAISHLKNPPIAEGSAGARYTSKSEMIAHLEDYTRSIEAQPTPAKQPGGTPLPDVDIMIERLAARLEVAPNDIKGWRMLGWSYFQTGRYEQAATSYARAVELDGNSAELKLSYEAAKAKASSSQTGLIGNDSDEPGIVGKTKTAAMSPREQEAAIRSMVDGLADRLATSPRDVEGWIRLMRSRVVLGEREVAATAFRKALEIFKNDVAASGRIAAAASELGMRVE